MTTRQITRRRFVSGAAKAAAAFYVVPRHVLGGVGYTAPSEIITRAVIGVGGMGIHHVTVNAEDGGHKTLAVCDVDRNHLDRAVQKAGGECQGYTDFRDVLERTDIDTIHVATPPHWHALIGIAAAQAGFDVLGEKPTTHTIREGQALAKVIRQYGRVFQVNTHGRFGGYYHFGASKLLRKLVDSGLLGTPLTVTVGRGQGFNWKLKEWSGRTDLAAQPVPDVLNYDMWLGPAPRRPYHPHRVHQSFRGYWDYDGGGLTDMGQHYLDPVQYFLNKDRASPVEIEADAPWPQHPDAVGLWGEVRMRYADGTRIVLQSGEWGRSIPPGGPLIEGPNGKVYDNYRTDPPGLFEALRSYPDPPRMIDFDTAVRTRRDPGGHIDATHRSCTLLNLAIIAIRTGRKLRFDPDRQVFVGDEQANRLAYPAMRAPWHLEEV